MVSIWKLDIDGVMLSTLDFHGLMLCLEVVVEISKKNAGFSMRLNSF